MVEVIPPLSFSTFQSSGSSHGLMLSAVISGFRSAPNPNNPGLHVIFTCLGHQGETRRSSFHNPKIMSSNKAIFLDGTVPCLGLETLPRDPYNIASLSSGNHFRASIAIWESNSKLPISFQSISLMAESIFPAVVHILKTVVYSWKGY